VIFNVAIILKIIWVHSKHENIINIIFWNIFKDMLKLLKKPNKFGPFFCEESLICVGYDQNFHVEFM
jgi:hypothetical protein